MEDCHINKLPLNGNIRLFNVMTHIKSINEQRLWLIFIISSRYLIFGLGKNCNLLIICLYQFSKIKVKLFDSGYTGQFRVNVVN